MLNFVPEQILRSQTQIIYGMQRGRSIRILYGPLVFFYQIKTIKKFSTTFELVINLIKLVIFVFGIFNVPMKG